MRGTRAKTLRRAVLNDNPEIRIEDPKYVRNTKTGQILRADQFRRTYQVYKTVYKRLRQSHLGMIRI